MTAASILLLVAVLGVTLLCVKPLGLYIANVMEGQPIWALRIGGPVERLFYRAGGVDASAEMGWKKYAVSLLIFNTLGVLVVYALQRLQVMLPLNPQGLGPVSPDSSFNTAVSFATNTNWQGYVGEGTMSYFVQMAALAVQNFLSAATGIAVAVALFRGLARHSAATIGNFWVDLTRSTLYVLAPLAFLFAIVLVSQGVIQNFEPYRMATTLEAAQQTLPMGPVASQEAIKILGTNGGGFLNANSAHGFENPTPLTNVLQMIAMLLIPAALTYTFGRMIRDTRQGWAVFAAMAVLFAGLAAMAISSEEAGNPRLAQLGADQVAGETQTGGNMEGKDVRFGTGSSALYAVITTATSTGSVNSMHDSFTPLGGFVPLFQMQLGEVVFGGVGAGMYSMLIFAIIGVFIAGLMIGRTPEYLGKKIEAFEMKMGSVGILVMPVLVLVGTAVAVSVASGKAGVANPGAHGFSEILYAFSSAANNNGSAFAGLSANTLFYNSMLAIAIWLGRFLPIVAVLAIAGSLAAKKRIPAGAGTLPTHGPIFVTLLIGTVLLVGALTFVPALALGPIVEHVMLWH